MDVCWACSIVTICVHFEIYIISLYTVFFCFTLKHFIREASDMSALLPCGFQPGAMSEWNAFICVVKSRAILRLIRRIHYRWTITGCGLKGFPDRNYCYPSWSRRWNNLPPCPGIGAARWNSELARTAAGRFCPRTPRIGIGPGLRWVNSLFNSRLHICDC